MKKAEDFRLAFGPATPGFESAAKETIRELRAKESQKKRRMAGEWLRYRKPVLAMAMALVLFIGFVALNGTLNLSGHMDQTRLGKDQYTAQPITTVLSMGAGQEEGDGAADGLPAATLSEEDILVELGKYDPELCAKMRPVNLSYDENGIRWEVLFGMLDAHQLAFVYSIQNPDEEKYAGCRQSGSFDAELPHVYSEGGSGHVLCEDKAANRTVYVFTKNYPYDTGFVDADAEINMYNSLIQEETVDLLPLLQQYGKMEEGVSHPEYTIGSTYEYDGLKPAPE